MTNKNEFEQEWLALHTSYDRYEWSGLVIKVTSVVLFIMTLILSIQPIMVVMILAVLWLQEAIWKTFQSRTEQRLLKIEAELSSSNDSLPFSFYSEWQANRPGHLGLIAEYAKHVARPTIAYPYSVLIVLILAQRFF